MHGRTGQRSTHTHAHTVLFQTRCYSVSVRPLLLRLAEVVAEVVVARRFRDDGGTVRDGNVLQVQEAEFNLHGEEDLQLASHRLTAHVPAQEDAQAICPQAELTDGRRQRVFRSKPTKTLEKRGGSFRKESPDSRQF